MFASSTALPSRVAPTFRTTWQLASVRCGLPLTLTPKAALPRGLSLDPPLAVLKVRTRVVQGW